MNAAPILPLPQIAILRDSQGPRIVGRSQEIPFDTEQALLRLAVNIGSPMNGNPFAFRLPPENKDTWCLGNVVRLPGEGSTLSIRLTIGPRQLLADVDPFEFQKRFPSNGDRGTLEGIAWPLTIPERRTVDQIASILKSGDSPLLLGAAQAILDGGHVAVLQSEIPETFAADLWQILPDASRREFTFVRSAQSIDFAADLLILDSKPAAGIPGYLTAEQCRNYPEGRYELALQRAAEDGNQADLDRLFARRTSSQVVYLLIGIIAFALIVVVAMKLF